MGGLLSFSETNSGLYNARDRPHAITSVLSRGVELIEALVAVPAWWCSHPSGTRLRRTWLAVAVLQEARASQYHTACGTAEKDFEYILCSTCPLKGSGIVWLQCHLGVQAMAGPGAWCLNPQDWLRC